jgi:outer membrane protein insertion porin family
MRRLLSFTLVLVLIPLVLCAQESKRKIVVFPFKMISKPGQVTYSTDLAGALAADLLKEGDAEVLSGQSVVSAVQSNPVDPARVMRVIERMGGQAATWGTVRRLEDGYSLEVSVVTKEQATKPKLFTATAREASELPARLKELAADVGNQALHRPKIAEIEVQGNRRIQREAILNKLDLKPGTAFRRSAIADEIRELYSMGYFDDVKITAEETPQGEIDLKIVLKERPSIKNIEIEGNNVLSKEEILDALTTKSFSVVSNDKIRSDIEKMKKMYEKVGYYEPKIEYEIKELSQNEAQLVFKINEGQKSYLTRIVFEGRDKLDESELRKFLTLKEKSWTWFLDDSGQFTRDKLEENRQRVIYAYLDNGFVGVQVGAPRIDMKDGSVTITFPIREGERFQVRKVNVAGDLVVPENELVEALKTKPKTWLRRSLLGEDVKELTKIYNNLGYAYADVEPTQQVNDKYNFVDITYRINKGDRVSIERVDVAGNERTRDKIIRRSIAISEGDLYNADKFEATKKRLESTEFFDGVKLKTSPGSKPDQMNVTVEVIEKKTGQLSAGLGYSSQDGAMGNINLQERNLFGMGIMINAKANVSGRRNTYDGSLTYPWMFDMPLSGTIRGYQSVQKETSYARESDGFSVHLGYPLYGFWTMSTGVARDSSKLAGFEGGFARSVRDYYKKYGARAEKYMNTSENSLSFAIARDTRNNSVIPSAGSNISIQSRLSGFGADVYCAKYQAESSVYQQGFWRTIFKLRTNAALVHQLADEPIPFDRRIVLGGPLSIRGYNLGQIGPKDQYGNIMGGDRAAFGNLECLFPLVDMLKLNGVVFFDAGNAWNSTETPFMTTVKAGFGGGVRWMSPMGPLRIEYGWKVNPEKGEDPGALAFNMGQLF